MPANWLFEAVTFDRRKVIVPDVGRISTPLPNTTVSPVKFRMTQSTTVKPPPELKTIPLLLVVPFPEPSMSRPRKVTTSFGPALIVIAFPWGTGACTPAVPTPSLTMLSALLIVTAPYPAGSSTSISPPAATMLSWTYWNVRQGEAGAPQPAASVPWPETQARFDKAWAGDSARSSEASVVAASDAILVILKSPLNGGRALAVVTASSRMCSKGRRRRQSCSRRADCRRKYRAC